MPQIEVKLTMLFNHVHKSSLGMDGPRSKEDIGIH